MQTLAFVLTFGRIGSRLFCAALRYLMKSDGFERVQQKQLFVFMRQSFLDLVDLDLDRKNLEDFNDSDFRLIKLVAFSNRYAARICTVFMIKKKNNNHMEFLEFENRGNAIRYIGGINPDETCFFDFISNNHILTFCNIK